MELAVQLNAPRGPANSVDASTQSQAETFAHSDVRQNPKL